MPASFSLLYSATRPCGTVRTFWSWSLSWCHFVLSYIPLRALKQDTVSNPSIQAHHWCNGSEQGCSQLNFWPFFLSYLLRTMSLSTSVMIQMHPGWSIACYSCQESSHCSIATTAGEHWWHITKFSDQTFQNKSFSFCILFWLADTFLWNHSRARL